MNVDFCRIPKYLKSRLYEEEGEVLENTEQWVDRVFEVVKAHVEDKPWGTTGRAALIICEDINKAHMVFEHII